MTNCPNCGAALEPYKTRCEYCGTYYFDLTAFDITEGKKYYIKFRTPHGIVTTLAIPKLNEVEVNSYSTDVTDYRGNVVKRFYNEKQAIMRVDFECIADKNNCLYIIQSE